LAFSPLVLVGALAPDDSILCVSVVVVDPSGVVTVSFRSIVDFFSQPTVATVARL
jgi:hypothetical protein